MRLLFPIAAAVTSLLAIASHAQSPSCTNRWLILRTQLPAAETFSEKKANAFGKMCLVGDAQPPRFGPDDIRKSLVTSLTPSSRLVSQPPSDVADFCPNYATLDKEDRAEFWRRLFGAIIAFEGSTDPGAVYWEQPRDRKTGKPLPDTGQYSIGLLQLSLTDTAYGCDLPEERSLTDPNRNLACGLKIFETRTAGKTIGGSAGHGHEGAAKYWSTLRIRPEKPVGHRTNETRAPIIKVTRASPHCS